MMYCATLVVIHSTSFLVAPLFSWLACPVAFSGLSHDPILVPSISFNANFILVGAVLEPADMGQVVGYLQGTSLPRHLNV